MVFSVRIYSCLIFFTFLVFSLSATSKSDDPNLLKSWSDIDAKEIVFFVNCANKKKKKDGSKQFPFSSIDMAMQAVNSFKLKGVSIKAKLCIAGKLFSNYSYVVACPLKIIGSDFKDGITFEKNAGFVVSSSYLHLENLTVTRKEFINEPRTVPVFYASSSNLILKNVKVRSKEGGNIFYLSNSNMSIDSSSIFSEQNSYCNVIEAYASNLDIFESSLECVSRKIITLDLKSSKMNMRNIKANLSATYFMFFARCFDSTIFLEKSSVVAAGNGKAEHAIIYNDKSQLDIEKISLEGFKMPYAIKNSKLDYLK